MSRSLKVQAAKIRIGLKAQSLRNRIKGLRRVHSIQADQVALVPASAVGVSTLSMPPVTKSTMQPVFAQEVGLPPLPVVPVDDPDPPTPVDEPPDRGPFGERPPDDVDYGRGSDPFGLGGTAPGSRSAPENKIKDPDARHPYDCRGSASGMALAVSFEGQLQSAQVQAAVDQACFVAKIICDSRASVTCPGGMDQCEIKYRSPCRASKTYYNNPEDFFEAYRAIAEAILDEAENLAREADRATAEDDDEDLEFGTARFLVDAVLSQLMADADQMEIEAGVLRELRRRGAPIAFEGLIVIGHMSCAGYC